MSFSSLMKSFQRGARWQLAICVSDVVLRGTWEVDPIFCSILSDSCGCWAQALLTLSQQQCHRVEVDALCWGVVMSSMKKSSQWREVWELLAAMQVLGVRCLQGVANTAICASWVGCIMFLNNLKSCHMRLNTVTLNSALSVCDKAARWRHILKLLEMFSFDEFSYNSAISSQQQPEKWQLALQLLLQVPQLDLKPDAFSLTGALQATAGAVQWRQGISLAAGHRDLVGVVTQNPAMAAGQTSGEWQLVLVLMRDLEERNKFPDVLSYNAVMTSCQSVAWKHTLALLPGLQAKRLQVDMTLCSNAMTACVNGRWSNCLALFSTFSTRLPAVSDASATNAAIQSCVKVSSWDAAIRWLQMGARDVLSYVLILDACARDGTCNLALQTSSILASCVQTSLLQIWKTKKFECCQLVGARWESQTKWHTMLSTRIFGQIKPEEQVGVSRKYMRKEF
eukprot:Skav211830  [mRNA]  locus=scaffold305:635627:636982:- [translate_table: standard]